MENKQSFSHDEEKIFWMSWNKYQRMDSCPKLKKTSRLLEWNPCGDIYNGLVVPRPVFHYPQASMRRKDFIYYNLMEYEGLQ